MTGFFASFVLYLGLVPSLIVNLLRIRTKVYYEDETRQNKKLKGKAIIISNHQHPLDGLVILHKYFFRRIYYIIGDFFKQGFSRLLRIFIRLSGGVIVDRETFSFDFFEQSKRLLNKGKLLLIFLPFKARAGNLPKFGPLRARLPLTAPRGKKKASVNFLPCVLTRSKPAALAPPTATVRRIRPATTAPFPSASLREP